MTIVSPRWRAAPGDAQSYAVQKHPDQIGYETSPPSNSIQTEVPIGGINSALAGPPVYWTHGNAHTEGDWPRTDGTIALMRAS